MVGGNKFELTFVWDIMVSLSVCVCPLNISGNLFLDLILMLARWCLGEPSQLSAVLRKAPAILLFVFSLCPLEQGYIVVDCAVMDFFN